MHSTASDGSRLPAEVVQTAIARGLTAIALTDHDTVAGIDAARAAAAGSTLEVIAGVELSAYQGDDEVHLLGLHLQDIVALQDALSAFRDARRERAQQIVARLNEIGVHITFADVLDEAGEAAIGRPHVAKALVENGWARDLRDAFDRYLGAGRPAYLEKRRLTIAAAIAMVHHAGGVAVLAHPGGHATMARITALRAHGLDGVEVLHPSHSADDRRQILSIVRELEMVPSGGSDCHGAEEGPRAIGSMQVPASWMNEQLERAKALRSA
jgi:predicted metal-dependent phosphoesterase TrpH